MPKWEDREVENFKRDYGVMSVESLACKYSRSEGAIYSKARILGLSHREFQSRFMAHKSKKYFFNEHYFDVIDSGEKAYFLGLLYADGYIRNSSIEIGLSTKDVGLLEEFRESVGSDRPIYRYIDRRSGRGHDGSRVLLSSRHMAERLVSLGCGKAKTFVIRFPLWLRIDLRSSFVRGYFDGDGSFFVSERGIASRGKKYRCAQVGVGITSNVNFVRDLYQLVMVPVGFRGIYIAKDRRTGGKVANLNIRGKGLLPFLRWIYEVDGPRMIRKYQLFLRFDEAKRRGLRGGDLVDFCKGRGDE